MNDELRAEIAEHVRRGEQLDRIETELLTPRHGLDDEQRAALWLFAWLKREVPTRRFSRAHAGAADGTYD